MKKNKLILFDWGNIVEANDGDCYNTHDAFNDLFKELGYKGNKDIFNEIGKYYITMIPTMKELEKTYNLIKEDFDLNGTFEEFVNKYLKYFDKINYYEDVRDYEISLKDKCYIGILSNLVIIDKERLDKQVGLQNYDYTFLSYELECRKPNLEIYEKVQSKIPFDKQNVLFIDDKLKNVEAAKEFGWQAFQITGLELDKIKEICKNFIRE